MKTENVSNKIHYSKVIICFVVKPENVSYKMLAHYSNVINCFDVKVENLSNKMLI